MLNKSFTAEFKSLGDGAPEGTFSAVVAAFGNVDRVGDRIADTAFDNTLENWRKSGDPIPVVLAHAWDDPWKHIGYAMPEDVKSVPGVGLYVEKAHLDVEDNPLAKQVHKLMERRSLKEFSFGYTIPQGGQKKAQDGAFDLTEVALLEFGPCMKGVNDETQLLEVKALLQDAKDEEDDTVKFKSIEDRLAAIESKLGIEVNLEPGEKDDVIPATTEDENDEPAATEDEPEGKSHTPDYYITLTQLEAETMLEAAEADSMVRDVMGKSDSIYEYTLILDDLEAELK